MEGRRRPRRLQEMHGIGVDRMGNIADKEKGKGMDGDVPDKLLRLENLDVDIPPDEVVQQVTANATSNDDDNSYLPFLGQLELRDAVAEHVSSMTGGAVEYQGERNCTISAGGLSGILNALLATVEEGDGVVLMEPVYAGLLNRVRLAGGIPRLVPFQFNPGLAWTLDRDKLKQVVEDPENRVTAMLLMSPCMPTGAYLEQEDWKCIADLCVKHELLVIYDAAMERLLFDDRPIIHPASLPGMADRTITVGSASKELRMIGWRVGWIVGPEQIMQDIGLVSMANVVVPVGIAQRAAKEALGSSKTTMSGYVEELQRRRDLCMEELEGLPVGKPAGGWSLLLRVDALGWKADAAAQALLGHGACVTPMTGWGTEKEAEYIRFVYSNEPRERLAGLGQLVRKALSRT
jgi:N-succinyldiaminopimelate aminotransferase